MQMYTNTDVGLMVTSAISYFQSCSQNPNNRPFIRLSYQK